MTQSHYNTLPSGTQLFEYRIESVLGQGGFGVTYKAIDTQLGRAVAIKEYYPREYCTRENNTSRVMAAGNANDNDIFKWGLDRFLTEAKTLARFHNPSIVAIRRFFELNNTAYIVMDFAEGRALDSLLKENKTLLWDDIKKFLVPLLAGLIEIHKAGVLHRDIKPGNIYLRQDGSPILLDFGAATQEILQHSRSVTSMATPGYGAFEQYSTHGKQGPYTDIYGLAATLYHVIAGKKPQDAPDRMLDDKLEPAVICCLGRYPKAFLNAIDEGLKLRPQDRPQSVDLWRDKLISETDTRSFNLEPLPKNVGGTQDSSINHEIDGSRRQSNKSYDPPNSVEATTLRNWLIFGGVCFLFFIGVIFSYNNGNRVDEVSAKNTATEIYKLRKAENYERAQTLLTQSLEIYPNNLQILLQAAELSWDLKNIAQAEIYVDKMLEIDNNFGPAHQNMQAIYSERKMYDESDKEGLLALSLGLDDEYSEGAYGFLSSSSIMRGDFNNALDYIDKAITYEKNAYYLARKAFILQKLQRISEAEFVAKQAILISGNDPELIKALIEAELYGLIVTGDEYSYNSASGILSNKSIDTWSGELQANCSDAERGGNVVSAGRFRINDLKPGQVKSFVIELNRINGKSDQGTWCWTEPAIN